MKMQRVWGFEDDKQKQGKQGRQRERYLVLFVFESYIINHLGIILNVCASEEVL